MSNVPKVVFTPTGLVVPPESAIVAGLFADFQDAFGGQLTVALETPQGQLVSSFAAIIADANARLAELVNQVDPDTASGFMQDAIARIYFLNRSPGAPTAVQCECVGAFNTVIPVGAQAQDTSGNRYVCAQAGVIPISGTITLPFRNVENGPIACPANTLTRIYQAINGWDTINNSTDGVPGTDVESQAAFALRRAQSVAVNARGSLPSIYGAVSEVPGVLDVYVYENRTNAVINVGATGYAMVPHSLYVAAVGGAPDAVAKAIWTKKDVGCDYNGNTAVVVEDPSGYAPPYPTYTVKYEIPAALPIKFAVEIAASDDLPNNIEDLVKAAIIATFNGTNGGQRVRIGSNLLAAKFYPAIIAIGPEVSLLSVLLGSVTPTLVAQLIGIDQAPVVEAADINVELI